MLAMIMLTLSSAPRLVADGAKLHLWHTPAFPTSLRPRERKALSQPSKCQQEQQEVRGRRGGGDFFYLTFTHDNDWLLLRKCFTSINPQCFLLERLFGLADRVPHMEKVGKRENESEWGRKKNCWGMCRSLVWAASSLQILKELL